MKAELKEVLTSCSQQERSEAVVFLRMLERVQDPAYHDAMRQRASDIREGRQVLSSETILELDKTLRVNGL